MNTAFGTPGSSTYIDPFKPVAPAPPTPVSKTVPPSTYSGPISNAINNTQQGADLVNANKEQAAKMGITIPGSTYQEAPSNNSNIPAGWTQQDYNDFKSTNPNIEPTDEDVVRSKLADAQAEYQTQAKQVQDNISNIQNGVTPLTPGEQAQVDGLKAQFQTLIDEQIKTNTTAEATGQMRGAQKGALEYDPLFQAKTIGAIVSAGTAKIADLQTKEAAAVASLTQSLKDNDIEKIKDSWSIYQDASKARQDALQKTITDTQTAIKDAQDQANKEKQYALDVAKFNQSGSQDAFDNAFKMEQEKETIRHDKATEAISAFNAGMGAGGGSNVRVTQSAQMGPSGAVDPVSQQQVLDQISQQYGPMTAIAIKGLADYTINPTDWSTRMVKGGQGMTREQAVTLAKMVDPTYSDALYPTRSAYIKNLASSQTGTVGSAVNAANKSINHLTAYVNTMATVGNKVSSHINAIFNYAETNPTRRQALNAATTEGLGVAEELAKFFKGSGTVDVASIDAWKSRISPNASPADVKGNTQGAITLLAGQLETLSEQYTATMGKAPTNNFLGPTAMANLSKLKNEGYQVDIPGVYFTDKAAYIKSDPDAQANMKTATQQLQAAGLPLTADNILQLAQQL